MNFEDIIREIVQTTDNTYSIYIQLTKHSYELRELVFRELSKPYTELEEIYINHLINTEDGFQPRYDETEDTDEHILRTYHSIENYTYQDAFRDYELEATKEWIKRKQKEIQQILSNFNKYKTFHLKTSIEKIKELYTECIAIDLISNNTKEVDFVNSFLGRNIDYQPKIVFKDSKQSLSYFLSLLMNRGVLSAKTEYNSIIKKSQIFIQIGDKPFSDLKSSFKTYEDYSPSDFNNSTKIEDIKNINSKLFN